MSPEWRKHADETFLVGMPGPVRRALEILLLLALVFRAEHLPSALWAGGLLLLAELALATALVRPWSSVHGGVLSRASAASLVLLAVLLPAMIERPGLNGPVRHLGVGVVATPRGAEDGARGGVVEVTRIEPRSAADGVLVQGDRVASIGGSPLDLTDPVADLTRRTHGDELPEDTTVGVLRGGAVRDVPVHLRRVRGRGFALGRQAAAVRDFSARHLVLVAAARGALLAALALLLLRANGQPISSLGIVRHGALRELGAAAWMTAGTFALQIGMAIPIAAVGALLGIADREATQRASALGVIAGQGSLLEFVASALVAAAFEEIVFRGFFMPRVRLLTGSWPWAIALVSIVFGLGHLYEGSLAVLQTALLGMYFSVLLLMRRRLLGPIVSHAAFNTIVFVVMRILLQSGAAARLGALAPG